ncbi:hypothetical protein MTO96_029541 [Rhipicephalus appendiculatus]
MAVSLSLALTHSSTTASLRNRPPPGACLLPWSCYHGPAALVLLHCLLDRSTPRPTAPGHAVLPQGAAPGCLPGSPLPEGSACMLPGTRCCLVLPAAWSCLLCPGAVFVASTVLGLLKPCSGACLALPWSASSMVFLRSRGPPRLTGPLGHGLWGAPMPPDSSEDDGDPPGQCCDDGCRTTYNTAVWTSRRQPLQRHLEAEHGVRIRRTVYLCTICGDTLGSRPNNQGCLVSQPDAAPPQNLQHRCSSCPRSFLTRRGLYNHEQRHRREAALLARQNVAAGAQPTTSGDGPPQQPDSDSDATPVDSAGTIPPHGRPHPDQPPLQSPPRSWEHCSGAPTPRAERRRGSDGRAR